MYVYKIGIHCSIYAIIFTFSFHLIGYFCCISLDSKKTKEKKIGFYFFWWPSQHAKAASCAYVFGIFCIAMICTADLKRLTQQYYVLSIRMSGEQFVAHVNVSSSKFPFQRKREKKLCSEKAHAKYGF